MSSFALIIAPFYRRPFHVGVLRVERFVNWLSKAGYHVVVVRAGERDYEASAVWGREVVVADPLGLHPDPSVRDNSRYLKEYHSLLRWGAGLVFCPDPGIAWSRRVVRQPLVRELASRAEIVLSSSPPESCHLAAWSLCRNGPARHFCDMRDGWLDEPLKRRLTQSVFQRWRERRLEHRVLSSASRVFVTSSVWRAMLLDRYPLLEKKVSVLTNCYPLERIAISEKAVLANNKRLRLLHAGQFTGSKYNNRPELLLEPLLEGMRGSGIQADIVLRGRFTRQDMDAVVAYEPIFQRIGCRLVTKGPVSVEELPAELARAHGLLLLSATKASLLAKIFDYLPSRHPILAVCDPESAVGELAGRLPQMFQVPLGDGASACPSVGDFLEACQSGVSLAEVPVEFTNQWGFERFSSLLPDKDS